MVDMNSDHILEVPDTPDRIQQSARSVSAVAANPISRCRIRFKTRNNSTHGSSSQSNICSVLPSNAEQRDGSDTDHIFKQAEAARILALSEDFDAKLTSQKPERTTRTVENEKRADVSAGTSSGEIKGEVVTNKTIEGPSRPSCVVPQRHVGQKKLVRNGCISPSNIAKRSVKVDEKQEMCSSSGYLQHPHPQLDAFDKCNVIDLTDSSPRIPRPRITDNDTLISANNMETRAAKRLRADIGGKALIPQSKYHANSSNYSDVSSSGCNNKGKETSHDILDSKRIGEACTRRVCRSAAGSSSVVNKNSSGMNPERGWRTTHNHTSKLPVSFMGTAISSCERESGSSVLSNQDHGTVAGVNNNSTFGATIIPPENLGNKTVMIGRGRRKHISASSHSGESSSACNEPAPSLFASSKTSAGRNYTSLRYDTPVITIDDMPPEAGPSSSGYNSVTSVDPTIQAQLEADELLARQLQEQLYNEAPRVAPTEEIDAIVAMSLQHEEATHRTSRPVRRFQNNTVTRGARASRSTFYRDAFRAELEAVNSTISRLQNTAQITLGLGAVLPRYPGASHIQPNIDLNDYDALLALDENNHQHTGASESQINNLPQSVVQSNSLEEPCAVCLENPSVGDTIRHLPCFHKFHKECIDEWLKRKKLCPVCKSGI